MIAIRTLLYAASLIALLYAFLKADRRPLERIANVICAGATMYLAILPLWR